MQLRHAIAVLAGVFVLSAPAVGTSGVIGDVIGFPVKLLLGSTIDKAKGDIDASVTKALGEADVKLKDHEGRISDLATALVDHTSDSLGIRITQVKTDLQGLIDKDAKNLLEGAIGKVGGVGAALINQLDKKATKLIGGLNEDVKQRLQDVDDMLKNRSSDLNKMVEDRVNQTNAAIKDRIVQLDEVARGRLGDVNAIASQQRIALEGMIVRVAVLIGGVVFLVFVMKALLNEYQKLVPEAQGVRGARRTAFFVRRLVPALGGPAFAALAGLALIGALYRWLPSGAMRDADKLLTQHQVALAEAVNRIDPPTARFEAAHLSYLDPDNTAHYAGLAAKTGLIRDVIVIPGLLATEASRDDFRTRLGDAERALGPRPDPDLLTLRAMDVWKTGATRCAEHTAASFAARALELAPRGFALEPLARAYLETFLSQPFVPADAEEGRDSESIEELTAAFAGAAPDPVDSPFSGVTELARMMRQLEETSTQAYVAMALANANAVVAARQNKMDVAQRERRARTQQATAVVDAWQHFDVKLAASSEIAGPVLLNVFGLNDALFTRARWFQIRADDIAAQGTPLKKVKAPIERLELAPARVAWARRYGELMSAPVRAVLDAQQATQFENWEHWAIEFEDALVVRAEAMDKGTDGRAACWRVAVAAAALGLYVENHDLGHRVPFASTIATGLDMAPLEPSQPQFAPSPGKSTDTASVLPTITDAPSDLKALLETRGQRLI